MRRGRRYLAAGLVGAVAMGTAQAQDSGGSQVGLTLSPGLFYEDDTSRARLGFGVSYDTATRNQRFSLGLDGAFDSGYDDAADSLRSPRLTMSYGLESRATAVDAQLSYRRDRISALVLDDDLDSDFLVIGTGQRVDLNSSASLTFGRDAPIGGTFDLGYRSREYLDTADPSLLDETTMRAGLALRFTIDPRLTARLSGRVSETDVDGPGTDQRRTSLSAGLDVAVSPTLEAGLTLGASRITDTGLLGTETTEGATATLSATRALPNGSLSGRISTDVTAGGREISLQVDRAMDLPGGGSLGFGGGVARIDGGDVQTQARLSWADATPTARYGLTLDRALAVNREGDSAINSQIGFSWQQDLDRLSTFGADLTLRDTDRLGVGADSTQTNLSLTFRRSLTQDWDLRTTYTHSWSREDGAADTDDYTVFLGFERGFQWRP